MTESIKVVFFDLGDTLVIARDGRREWMPDAKEVLGRLRDKGIRVGILSNTNGYDRERLLEILPEDFSYESFADELIVLSFDVGVKKPELGIYREAIKRAGVPANQTMYVGEKETETSAAQAAGMRSLMVRQLPQDWETLVGLVG
jgi:putative hydrolase of the HAD superfamily